MSNELKGRKIVLGVSGSIAAYKAADIASKLVQAGATVAVVMTPNAAQFITPLTLQTLTGVKVLCHQYDTEAITDPTHISLLENADLVLIAPATANILGKIAHGIADDMLTSLMLAVNAPVILAPAMNDRMFNNPIVQENIKKLRALEMEFIDPEEGYLACGTVAQGRLADPQTIVARVIERLR